MAQHGADAGLLRRLSLGLAVCGLAGSAALVAAGGPAAAAAPLELPSYLVRRSGVDAEQAAALAKGFGLDSLAPGEAALARTEDGSLRFADEKSFLEVPAVELGETRQDEDGNVTTASRVDVAALARLKVVDDATALQTVGKALSAAGLYPQDARPTVGHTTLEMVDTTGKPTVSAVLDTTVSFSYTLGGLPFEGPGAKARVSLGADGTVTQLSYSSRELEQAEPVPVLDTVTGTRRCAQAMGGRVRVQEAAYAYFAPALSTKLDRIEPSFRCTGVNRDGTPAQIVFVPAGVDAKVTALPPAEPPRRAVPGGSLPGGSLPGGSLPGGSLPGGSVGDRSARSFGVVDVGSEGTGPCSGLPWTGSNLASFNKQFTNRGIPVEFSWLDGNAWEDDFKDPTRSGNDSNWTDHVDMTYWQGHGSPTGFSFSGCSSTDDTFLSNTDARWGNGDVEWMSLFTCLVLAEESGGQKWWQRWGGAFDGLHQINSFHTVSYHSASHGGTFANYLLRSPFLWWNKPMSVRKAWAQASIDDQPSSVVWASMGPVGPGGSVNFNDYFWGKGAVGPDVPASSLTGWWYIKGTS